MRPTLPAILFTFSVVFIVAGASLAWHGAKELNVDSRSRIREAARLHDETRKALAAGRAVVNSQGRVSVPF
jgi:hypothetical protein